MYGDIVNTEIISLSPAPAGLSVLVVPHDFAPASFNSFPAADFADVRVSPVLYFALVECTYDGEGGTYRHILPTFMNPGRGDLEVAHMNIAEVKDAFYSVAGYLVTGEMAAYPLDPEVPVYTLDTLPAPLRERLTAAKDTAIARTARRVLDVLAKATTGTPPTTLEVRRLLPAHLRAHLDAALEALVAEGRIIRDAETRRYHLAPPAPADH